MNLKAKDSDFGDLKNKIQWNEKDRIGKWWLFLILLWNVLKYYMFVKITRDCYVINQMNGMEDMFYIYN